MIRKENIKEVTIEIRTHKMHIQIKQSMLNRHLLSLRKCC